MKESEAIEKQPSPSLRDEAATRSEKQRAQNEKQSQLSLARIDAKLYFKRDYENFPIADSLYGFSISTSISALMVPGPILGPIFASTANVEKSKIRVNSIGAEVISLLFILFYLLVTKQIKSLIHISFHFNFDKILSHQNFNKITLEISTQLLR